ncbi:hypothetical protein EV361DRAFT_956036 [Lentinula raphanica]|nr:hypothetical protein EV361DRAFT_956036 [Lentinula raphanica]
MSSSSSTRGPYSGSSGPSSSPAPPPSTVTPSLVSAGLPTIRPSPLNPLPLLNEISDQVRALWEGQLSTKHLLRGFRCDTQGTESHVPRGGPRQSIEQGSTHPCASRTDSGTRSGFLTTVSSYEFSRRISSVPVTTAPTGPSSVRPDYRFGDTTPPPDNLGGDAEREGESWYCQRQPTMAKTGGGVPQSERQQEPRIKTKKAEKG